MSSNDVAVVSVKRTHFWSMSEDESINSWKNIDLTLIRLGLFNVFFLVEEVNLTPHPHPSLFILKKAL